MINASDEDDFAIYEEQFWGLLGGQQQNNPVFMTGPHGIIMPGAHIVRICRKIKTKNGTQKGFFKKTKLKEKQMNKEEKKMNKVEKKKSKR